MENKILAVIRTSTVKQEIESQKKEVTDFCISKGFKEDNIIFVVGFGASARKRNEKYLQMLEEIKTTIERNNIKFVAVWHLNRLGRTEENLTAMKEYFEKNHIQVFVKNPSLTLFNSDGTLNNGTSMAWTIFALMIKFETLELMEKLHRGREYRREQKKYLGGKIPYGYFVNENGYFEIDENESKVVSLIFDLYSSGKYSASKIVAELNEKSILTRNGKPFHPMTISTLLRNKDYITGEKYPILITEEQFEVCRKISENNNLRISKEIHISLGSKLLVCPICKHSFSVLHGTGNNVDSYLCNGAKLGSCSAEVKAIRMSVWDFCAKYISSEMYTQILLSQKETDKDNIQNQIKDIEKRLDSIKSFIEECKKKQLRLNRLYIDGKYQNDVDYNNDYEKIETEHKNLVVRKDDLEDKISILQNQLNMISNKTSSLDWLPIRQNILRNTHLAEWKQIVNLCVKQSYLKKVNINGNNMVAIIFEMKDNNHSKNVFLWNRRFLYIPISSNDNENGISFYKIKVEEQTSLKYLKDMKFPEHSLKLTRSQIDDILK